jgi:hypothetical protein
MKHLTVYLVTLICSISFAQIPIINGKIFHEQYKKKIEGSPYHQKMFANANVKNIVGKTLMRYNIYADEFEFISSKKDTLILEKMEDFSTIMFPETSKSYVLTTYTNRDGKLFYGYLLNLYSKADFGLLKKENISLSEEKVAKTTLEQSMPAKYSVISPDYFIKTKTKTTEFPRNKKNLIKLFPDKKSEIETYLKSNKINFDDETDLKKIINLVSGF